MKTYTLQLPDDEAEQVEAAAAAHGQTPEAVLQAILKVTLVGRDMQAPGAEDPMIAVMRVRGHLATPAPYTAPADVDLPPYGSPEFDQMLEEIGEEASEALEQTGLDVNALVER